MRAIQTHRLSAPKKSTAVSKHRYIRVGSIIGDLFGGCRVTLSGRDSECLSLSLITFTAILPRQNLYDWCSKMVLRLKPLWKFIDQSLFLVIRERNFYDKAYANRRYTGRRNESSFNIWKPC